MNKFFILLIILSFHVLAYECPSIPKLSKIQSVDSAFCYLAGLGLDENWVISENSRKSLSSIQLSNIDSCLAVKPDLISIDTIDISLIRDTNELFEYPCGLWLRISNFACYLKNDSLFSKYDCTVVPSIQKFK